MKDNGQTAQSRLTDVAIFASPITVPSEEVCDARKAGYGYQCPVKKSFSNEQSHI